LCGRPADRGRAVALGDLLLARYEEGGAGFRTAALPKRDGTIQKAGKNSGENARAARFLVELATLTGTARYREAAMRAWAAFEKKEDKLGLNAADWALAAHDWSVLSFPSAPTWVNAAEPERPVRKKSVTIKLGRR
jgi:uncharacterized protein YyaL (SSP411 family)